MICLHMWHHGTENRDKGKKYWKKLTQGDIITESKSLKVTSEMLGRLKSDRFSSFLLVLSQWSRHHQGEC